MNKYEIHSLDSITPVKAMAFDVVEALFSLDSLRPRLASAGLEGNQWDTWFASFLRDAFALEMYGEYTPFRTIAQANLSLPIIAPEGINQRSQTQLGPITWSRRYRYPNR